ncbi:MAG: CotS family spore coat protein [Cellulosilyticaceae bacterium]
MRALTNELVHQYDFNVKKYQYVRSNYYLDTNKGKMILRKMNITKEQIMFEYEVVQYLIGQEFTAVPRIYTTKKTLPYASYQDKNYVLQELKVGEEIDFKNEEDLKNTIAMLAHFHIYARNLVSNTRYSENSTMKNIYEYCLKRHMESKKMKKSISDLSNKPNFEKLFLDNYRYYETLELMALEQMDTVSSQLLIDEALRQSTIIHNDYSYHTINKTPNNQYYINNLDSCAYNLQILDLAHILTRIMQKNNWNIELLKTLTEIYDTIRPLSNEETKALRGLLIFPEKYANICHNYMQTRRRGNYSMFEVKWLNMLEYLKNQQETAQKIIYFL